MRIFFVLVATMACLSLSAVGLSVVEQKNKYGYADESGKIVIKPKYTRAYPFQNGKAKVSNGNKWGYIDENGKAVIPIVYDNIEPFEKGLARVQKDGKYGYIKEDGSVYIKPEYNFIGSFNDAGWLWVGKGKTLSESTKGLYHYDKLIIKPSGKTRNLGFYVKTDSIDYTDGRPVTAVDGEPENNEIKKNFCKLSVSSEPYIWSKALFGYYRVYDLDGNMLASVNNAAIGMPRDGYCITRSYSKKKGVQYYDFNYVSADGKSRKLFKSDIRQTIDEDDIYEGCKAFDNGYALCRTGSSAYIINTNGTQVSGTFAQLKPLEEKGYISKRGDLYGFVSESGLELLAPKYAMLLPSLLSSGVYAAKDASSGRYGYVDRMGKQVIPFRFESALGFAGDRAYVKEAGAWGIVDVNGNYVVKNRWDDVVLPLDINSDFIWVKDNDGKWKCLQISTDRLSFSNGYDDALAFDSKGRALVNNDNVFGAVSYTGETVIPQRFSTLELASKALKHIDNDGKDTMTDAEAYRFNIYHNNDRHKYRLSGRVDDTMWDY